RISAREAQQPRPSILAQPREHFDNLGLSILQY
ncbi:MAG: hypothetical protein ACI91F_003365, partial [Candidatus Binatia bacterium]